MTAEEHGWVVCAPGDPNDRQIQAIVSMAGSHRLCMYLYNADTGEVAFTVDRESEFYYIVDREGQTRVTEESP